MVNVTVYSLDEVIVDVILTIEKHRVPMLEQVGHDLEHIHKLMG